VLFWSIWPLCEKIEPVNRKKVAVGLSGGVDSAVSALLLKRAGFDVVGVHLYCWPPKSEIERDGVSREEWIKKNGCRADEDKASALKTALELGIPFKVLDFSEEYNQRVIKYFYDEYEAGRTPNPDVLCNSEIKFGLFLEWAMQNGFDYIATGHYARTTCKFFVEPTVLTTDSSVAPAATDYLHTRQVHSADSGDQAELDCVSSQKDGVHNDLHSLFIPKDKHKDQTYFLWKLTQKELVHTLFPLGDYQKDEVRKIAKEASLSVADKKDSQGICFVGNVEVREFLARRLKVVSGDVVDIEGNVVGKHDGVWFYTIGQRGGWEWLPEAQKKYMAGSETPVVYVVKKEAKTNTLTVGVAREAVEDLFEVKEVNLINSNKKNNLVAMKDLFVRIRHGGELIGARVSEKEDGYWVELSKSVRGIAAGQSAVFYSGDGECLGGGVIQ
jgi:tRNA-uridine 2-sulfurtransferase